ncbi:short-chain oxidoreductase [Pyricularia oryzae 70-15]|uniref:Short-chain oxidoreductase n=2 Tax=Pyricularia oryzae TaxID=318829 RepID=G4MY08_PYRO7|nr:short-chain oxidoreductase [Pyricularia oryzae 70-15]EHA53536.1 short-chain oxidoreductase [Pyricularia oryzae 70-15]ELQ35587.1 retinol dehydrogenase 8 [Pyricularia oryzae Y34]KAI7914257.1 short-chain oxidoreductase [Pyricularia oryzae]
MSQSSNKTLTAIPTTQFTTPSRPLTFLVTGCSSGLGLALCRAIQSAGHVVVATSRNPSRTPALVAEIESAGGRWLALDVDSPDAGGRLVEGLEQGGTAIDVLINNAGWSIHQAVEQFEEAEVRDQFETVFFGPYRLVRAVLPHMRRRRFGVVVNVSSGAGLEGRESMGVYAGAKAAMDGVCKVLAKEVADFNVRVVTAYLGTFGTNMANAARTGAAPLADDYHGTTVHDMIGLMAAGTLKAAGDADKAAKVIVDVVVGAGVGEGRQGETALPLGPDVLPRLELVRDRLGHALEVFGAAAESTRAD